MIQGYPDWPSVSPGDILTLHISTDQPQFRIDFYRQGQTLAIMGNLPIQYGYDIPQGSPDVDWGWPSYDFQIPDDWPSGVYIAIFIQVDENGNDIPDPQSNTSTADGRSAKALFVVRSSEPGQSSTILYKVPLSTFHAYNFTGGGNLGYCSGNNKITIHKPGAGTGGLICPEGGKARDPNSTPPYDDDDVYDTSSPRQTFAHYDAPFICWLESNGYQVDYCTDFDIHEDPDFLSPYCMLLSVGHDEYWSENMRTNIESFVRNGGHVAFFSGNTCWWRIHFADDDTAIMCNKSGPNNDQWYLTSNPENSLTGVSYRNGGGNWIGARPTPSGYTVQYSDHWIYEGTGLNDGDVFGDIDDEGNDESVVGYECDGALFSTDDQGISTPTGTDGTPLNFVILGIGPSTINWNNDFGFATMGIYSNVNGGVVFSAATCDWSRVLAINQDPVVDRITRNILDVLQVCNIRIVGPFPTICGQMLTTVDQLATFYVDTSDLPSSTNLHYEWLISSGNIQTNPPDQPTFQATMPSSPDLVTLTVKVRDGSDIIAFGTMTFTPLSIEEYLWLEFFCQLLGLYNNLTRASREGLGVVQGAEQKNRFLVDPIWDPIRGDIHASALSQLTQGDLKDIIEHTKHLTEITEKMMRRHQTPLPPQRAKSSNRELAQQRKRNRLRNRLMSKKKKEK